MITERDFDKTFKDVDYNSWTYIRDGASSMSLNYKFSLDSKKFEGKFEFIEFEEIGYCLIKATIIQKINFLFMKFSHYPRKIKIGDLVIYNGLQPYVVIKGNGQLEVKVL